MAIAESDRIFWFETHGDDVCADCGHERKYHRGVGSAGFCQKCPLDNWRSHEAHNFYPIGHFGAVEWCNGDNDYFEGRLKD